MNEAHPLITVVVPAYFEEEVIEDTYLRLTQVCQGLEGYRYELLFINDGSRDQTLPILKRLAATDHHLNIISFSRNFGHQIAITAGIDQARGDAVIVIDADLQDPPELIPQMLECWKNGAHVVYGKRRTRHGETAFKKWTAHVYYRLIRRLTQVEIPADTGDFRLMDRKVVNQLRKIRETNRFMRGLVAWVGFRQVALEYERAPREKGETKYPLFKMLRFAMDGIISFSNKPLALAMNLGFFSIVVAIFILFYSILQHLLGNTIQGWTSIIVAVLFLGGVQLFTLGIIGEYLSRVYDEIKGRPLYIIDEEIGFQDKSTHNIEANPQSPAQD